MAEFVPFPVPTRPEDTPLVVHAGADYRCSGCGGVVPAGAWLFESVHDGMVVGLIARRPGASGLSGNPHQVASAVDHADGEILHSCGVQDG
jgi:hypothetical protein